jgi:hypothetical protein
MRRRLPYIAFTLLLLPLSSEPLAAQEAPGNLVAMASGSTIVLTWTGTAGAQGYRVYRALSESGSFGELTSAPIVTTTFTDAMPPRATLWYKVAAMYGGGIQPGYTAAVPVTSPALTPVEVAADFAAGRGTAVAMERGEAPEVEVVNQKLSTEKPGNATSDDLTIFWGRREGALLHRMPDATGFTVARAKSGTGPWVTVTTQQTNDLVREAGAFVALMPDESVFYRVTATYAGKLPASSAPVGFTRSTQPVEELKRTPAAGLSTTVKLTWLSAHSETRVFRNGAARTTNPVTGVWGYGVGADRSGRYMFEYSETNVPPGTYTYKVAPLLNVTGKGWVAGDLAKQPSVAVTVKAREPKCPASMPNCQIP